MDKSALRARYRQERKLFTEVKDPTLTWLHILQTSEFESAQCIASYHSYGDEPDTTALNQQILLSGKTLLLPRVLPDLNLEWVKWNGSTASLKKNKNFYEPIGEPINAQEIDAVIVPCLHVNRSGFRLGQGGGSYDRALANISAYKMGLIYSGEITNETLPIEAHDQKLDAVATPELIVRF